MNEPVRRQPYEQVECPDVAQHDYVRFHAIIEREDHVQVRTKRGTKWKTVPICVPRGGVGQVLRIASNAVHAVPPRARPHLERGELITLALKTARVDTGLQMGVVTAVLNGAEITGVQGVLC